MKETRGRRGACWFALECLPSRQTLANTLRRHYLSCHDKFLTCCACTRECIGVTNRDAITKPRRAILRRDYPFIKRMFAAFWLEKSKFWLQFLALRLQSLTLKYFHLLPSYIFSILSYFYLHTEHRNSLTFTRGLQSLVILNLIQVAMFRLWELQVRCSCTDTSSSRIDQILLAADETPRFSESWHENFHPARGGCIAIIYARYRGNLGWKLTARICDARTWPVESQQRRVAAVINDIALTSRTSDFADVSATPMALILINQYQSRMRYAIPETAISCKTAPG